MEATHLTVRGEAADRFATAFVETKAAEQRRSINKRGVRNIHRYRGDGFVQVTYERAAAHENSWLMVSVLVEAVDERARSVAVTVGGGGEGPFKFEEISPRRLLEGEDAVGSAGRFATVLEDIEAVCESLDLTVTTEWESETESGLAEALSRKVFDG